MSWSRPQHSTGATLVAAFKESKGGRVCDRRYTALPTFVGGSVHASGFIVGHYNDSALFVGGDLTAAGYVPRAKPYPDLPGVAPHQVAGKIEARRIDVHEASDEALRAAFVDEVLAQDGEDLWLDENAVIERSNAGLPVWR